MLRAISLYQPWASLIAHGLKQYETRSWPTNFRGELAIQAGRHWTDEEREAARRLRQHLPQAVQADLVDPQLRGCVLCLVELLDCEPTDVVRGRVSAEQRERGDYTLGRYALRVGSVQRLVQPVPVRGRMRIWTLPADEEAAVRAALM